MPRGHERSPAGLPTGPGTIMAACGNDEAKALALQRVMAALLEWQERAGASNAQLAALVETTAGLLDISPWEGGKEDAPC
jgi:hypothetical protein